MTFDDFDESARVQLSSLSEFNPLAEGYTSGHLFQGPESGITFEVTFEDDQSTGVELLVGQRADGSRWARMVRVCMLHDDLYIIYMDLLNHAISC